MVRFRLGMRPLRNGFFQLVEGGGGSTQIFDVDKTIVSATGTGTSAPYSLQSVTINPSNITANTSIINFQSLLYVLVSGSTGSVTQLNVTFDTTNVFSVNLFSANTFTNLSFYITLDFNLYFQSTSNVYLITSAQSPSYINKGFTAEDASQATNFSSFNPAISHTLNVGVQLDGFEFTISNYFTSLAKV